MPSNEVYTLVRGPKALNHTTRYQDFSNQAFSVSFKATKPVGVTSLGFYGPYATPSAVYRLKFNVYEVADFSSKKSRRLITSVDRTIEAYQDRLFYIDFDEPLRCPEKTWIRIEFMLNGPATSMCRKIFPDYRQPGGLIFDFYSSSKQMPEIKYVLL
ncbi:unnamed protein product [Allacma fusca]|uniref:PHR domain-containing protein n=1 Tax=Allacma fusca TaxID=39272 RepID=A0A8J2Q0K8_9HEXA|nr:unnamed protein product [Allacma fusca]